MKAEIHLTQIRICVAEGRAKPDSQDGEEVLLRTKIYSKEGVDRNLTHRKVKTYLIERDIL